jgi:hypothetical protein
LVIAHPIFTAAQKAYQKLLRPISEAQIHEKRDYSAPGYIEAKVSKNSPVIFANGEFGISSVVWDLEQMSEIPNSKKSIYF